MSVGTVRWDTIFSETWPPPQHNTQRFKVQVPLGAIGSLHPSSIQLTLPGHQVRGIMLLGMWLDMFSSLGTVATLYNANSSGKKRSVDTIPAPARSVLEADSFAHASGGW